MNETECIFLVLNFFYINVKSVLSLYLIKRFKHYLITVFILFIITGLF